MDKLIFNDSFNYAEGTEDLVRIVDNPDHMKKKVASQIRDEWGDIKPEKGRALVHIIALSSFEKTGANNNGDAFEEFVCKRSHGDFAKKARLYRHHKRTEEKDKDGDVIKTAYNDKMGRVELLVSAIEDKCADWLGDLDKGGSVNFSMGWHCTDGDICSICSNKAHRRDQYCDHLKKTASAPYGLGKVLPDGRACFTFNRDGYWNDISYVNRGADMVAMDLAKVASLGGESVIGGAELAEIYGSTQQDFLQCKKDVVARISSGVGHMIKSGAAGVLELPNDPEFHSAINGCRSTFEIIGGFEKTGSSMPFATFCDLFSRYMPESMYEHIKSAKDNFPSIFEALLSSDSELSKAATLSSFDKNMSTLSPHVFSCKKNDSPETMTLMKKASVANTAPTPQAKAFVQSYVAYKIAAASKAQLSDEQLFDFFLLN